MAISAKDVMDLRKKTGCGMMECKKALVETNGDFEAAIKFLREKGLSVAEKKADRIAAEGVVDIIKSEDGKTTAMIEVNAETDFVAKNASFKEFVHGILHTILANKPASIEALMALPFCGGETTVEAELKDKIFTIGEKMTIRRFEIIEGFTGTYIHGTGSAGVIAKFDTSDEIAAKPEFAEYAKNICMQIAAMAPSYLDKSDVPDSVIQNEKDILINQIKNDPAQANKPENIIEKMVIGKVSKFYDQNCLLQQAYVKDEDIKVSAYTENTGKELGGSIKIVSFVKYERGEGIEKREDDFAGEIAKLVNG